MKFVAFFLFPFFLLCQVVFAKISESEKAFLVSGKNYVVEFSKANGSITKIEALGKDLALDFSGNLWTAKFADKSQTVSKNAKFFGKIEDERLSLSYQSEEIDVLVFVKDGGDFIEIESKYTPKKADLVGFSIPSQFTFKPENLVSLSAQTNYPRNSGFVFNKNFFMPKSPDSKNLFWIKGKSFGQKIYRQIFESPMRFCEKKPSPITLGEDAAEWLGEKLCKELVKTEKIPARTFGKNSADIVIANSKNGVFIGGKKFGEGAVFRIGGYFLNGESQVKYVKAMALHAAELAAKNNRNKICVIAPNTNQNPIPAPLEYAESFGKNGNVCIIRTPQELLNALSADNVAAIINPLQDFCMPMPNASIAELAEPIRDFAENGGYWFETGGESFSRQMVPKKYYSVQARVPSSIADFIHFNIKNVPIALYSAQPITWQPFEGLSDKAKMFTPSEFSFGGSEKGGYVDRCFLAYVNKGETFKAPSVKILFGKSEIESAKSFCADNNVLKTLEQKLPKAFLEKLKKATFTKISDSNVKAATNTVSIMDYPALIHTTAHLRAGLDGLYPDLYPPRASYGTNEEYLAFIDFCKAKGHLYMPYTNTTWWCDFPRGPTFAAKGEAALALDANGKKYFESYGHAKGWTTCMWHKNVRDANKNMIKLAAQDYNSDMVFQDQCGSRSFKYDYNKAAPSPSAYPDGILSTVIEDSKKAYLSTEDGWWALCDSEIQFCGFSFSFMHSGALYKNAWDAFPKDGFTLGNLAGAFFHDKVVLTHHNLGMDVENPVKLAYTVAYGFSMINHLNAKFAKIPQMVQWRRWTAQVQISLLSKLVGKPMQNFEHKWANADLDGDDSATIFSQYGDIKIAAAIGNATLKANGNTVANNGFFAKGKNVECAFNLVKIGNIKAETPSNYIIENCGKELKFYFFAKPNEKVLFNLPKNAVAVRLENGSILPIKVFGNVGTVIAPKAKNNYQTLFKGAFIF